MRLMQARLFISALAMAALGGCALKQAPTQSEVLEQALPATTTTPAAWYADANDAAVADDWVSLFNDPALDAIVAEAIAYNLDLRQAAERVRIAQQNTVLVGARLLPNVGAQLGARATRDKDQDSGYDSTIAYAGVAWELDLWGRLRSERSAAEAGYEATALDYAYARQSLAALVARSWYLAIETRNLVALGERSVQVFEDLLTLVKFRRTSGKGTDLDVVQVEAELATVMSQLELARQAYGESRRALEVLLGRYPAAEISVAADYPQLPPPVAAGLPLSLLERRPDIVAAERAVVAAFRSNEAAKLARLPSLSVSLLGGRLGDQVLDLLQLNPWLAAAGIGLSIPIYEGGALRAQVEIATAQEAQAIAEYGAKALGAFREVEDALANDALIARRIPYEESALKNRTAAVDIATQQYQAGTRDLLWLAQLQLAQLEAEATLIQLRNAQGSNRIQLYLALGGSFDETPAAILPANPDEEDQEAS
jgi:NodT family efflux transporter outer membrane factor (OMF) lipoprotein